MAQNIALRVVELAAKDLAGQTFESLSARFRGETAVVLLTALEHLEGYVVLNVFAPLHAAFWATPSHDGFFRHCHDSLRHLAGDAGARERFMKDLRQANIRKSDRQIRLFDGFARCLNVAGRSIPGLGEGELSYAERWRFESVGVPAASKDAALAHLEREVRELGRFAFFRIDESVHLADPRRRSSVAAYLFHHIDYLHFGEPAVRTQCKDEVLAELKWVVKRLESGAPFDAPIEPVWIIKGVVGMTLFPAMLDNPAEFADPVARDILSYRARLVRLLGWPHQFHAVSRALAGFRQQVSEEGLGAFLPYDIEAELSAYLEAMRTAFPVLEAPSFVALRA